MSKYLTFHLSQSVDGALNHWGAAEWHSLARENKTTVENVRKYFEKAKLEGKRVISIGGECEGFSYDNGCPGHVEYDAE